MYVFVNVLTMLFNNVLCSPLLRQSEGQVFNRVDNSCGDGNPRKPYKYTNQMTSMAACNFTDQLQTTPTMFWEICFSLRISSLETCIKCI